MAFIVMDPADESSYLEPSYLDRDPPPGNPFRAPLPVGYPSSLPVRNLCSDFENDSASSSLLPVPSAKETIQVYLRVKPKTVEESEISASTEASSSASSGEHGGGAPPEANNSTEEEAGELIKIESEHQLAMNAPKDSNTYKNSMNGAGQLLHRFAFTKIFSPETSQSAFFQDMVLPRMRDLMEGQNQLLFTYGATSSGKTYTIQGSGVDPGILPRALDVIFNSIGERQMVELKLKPNCFNRVVQMKDKDVRKLEEDKQGVFHLGLELAAAQQMEKRGGGQQQHSVTDFGKLTGASKLSEETFNAADMTNLSQDDLATMFPSLPDRVREDSEIPLKHDDINYAVWISFAEIYNETIYDLLEKIPPVKRKGDKPKRNPLKLAEDKNGSIYIKGLKEIKVNSANEAYQVMMIGRENLHFAATRLNHHSSRSHCIFTIKVIRVAKTAKPHLARVSMLSFCDLAGSERIKKTLNTGERQREAGNINTSLLVLGRCMKAIRHNQITKDKKKQQLVPFRESKLTRMFKSFLTGYGKASMVVNVSQAPYLFDETVQVMKFAAVASKVTVVQLPETPPTVVRPANNPRKRKTRFSMMVDEHQAKRSNCNSTLMGRGSIAWERPAFRSTMCPTRPADSTVVDETLMEEDEEAEASVMDATIVDQRYEGLMKLVDDLKDQLIREKQKNLTLEKEVRTELCDEFNTMLVEVEKDWEKRLQDERERTEELSEWRINKVQEVYKAKLKRKRQDDEDEAAAAEDEATLNETAAFRKAEVEILLEEKTAELRCQEEKTSALQEQLSGLAKEKAKLQDELVKKGVELEKVHKAKDCASEELKECRKELEAMKESEESKSAEPIIEDLKRQVEEGKTRVEKLEEEKKGLKELLDEAGEDFVEKKDELDKVLQTLKEQEQEMLQEKVVLTELTAQLEESRLLLQDSAARMEEREQEISDLEEAVKAAAVKEDELREQLKTEEGEKSSLKVRFDAEAQELKEEIAALKEKCGQVDQKHNSEKERVERELNDEIEELKGAKKKLKAQLEEKSKGNEGLEKDVSRLEGEVKSLIQAEKQQRQASEEHRAEASLLRKQLKDLGAKESATKKSAEATLKEKESEVEKLQIQLKSLQKEEHALDVVSEELQARNRERDELNAQVVKLQSEVQAKEYDLSKMKEERDSMMNTYEQRLKKTTEELSMERREAIKMREVMSRSTPAKNSASAAAAVEDDCGCASPSKLARKRKRACIWETECNKLREETQRQTDTIKKLESFIPAKKQLNYPSSGDEAENSESDAEVFNLKGEVVRLQRELENQKTTHAKELQKMKRTHDKKVVQMYQNTNRDLQRNMSTTSGASTSIATDHSTLEADNSNNVDGSLIEDTPGGGSKSRKRAKRTANARSGRSGKARSSKAMTDSASQASFEDSNVENDEPEEPGDSDSQWRPRRSSRIKRSRPVKKARSNSSNSAAGSNHSLNLHHHSGDSSQLSVLQAIQESSPTPKAASAMDAVGKTPSARKRQLYNGDGRGAEEFTPPTAESVQGPTATPRTVVKRQLRSRSSRKKC